MDNDKIFPDVPLSSRELSDVFAHIQLACVLASTDRKILSMNAAAQRLFGYDERVIGLGTEVLYAQLDEHILQGHVRCNPDAASSAESVVIEYQTQDGHRFLGKTSSGVIKGPSGEVQCFIAFIQDESERLKAERTLNKLHSITSSRRFDFTQRVQAILELGCEQFGLPIGIFSHIEGRHYEIRQAIHPENSLVPGMTYELGETYCCQVYQANDVQGFHCVSQSHIATHPCFAAFGLEAYLGAPIFVDGERYGTLNFSSPTSTRPFRPQDKELVRLFAEWIGHELARQQDLDALKHARNQLEVLASTDPLTGLANRRYIESTLDKQLDLHHRYGLPLVVALFDFDHFKRVNDQFGHQMGDEALQRFGAIVATLTRKEDVYARWGGEEFLALLPNTSLAGALTLIERITHSVKAQPLEYNGAPIALSVSVGVTAVHEQDNASSVLKRADALLYRAKANGRDRTESDPVDDPAR
ncbi:MULTISPECIES: sensor domain-containing diguanylate cyclase [Vibrio]|uniref:sensor domain-containing diguanylate cyclase n=1 Tax=Vibrio TaxID=662 RepID=UPI0001B93DAF|nr:MULTISPECIES: diguanylate cyclase [Vibrio]EEX34472.1 intracellular signaling protein (PAS,GAF,GGDEF domains) [Vibrio coralliilyticus ATCC BAA-450]MDE3898509.1 diguanylate cyclase [Vibrio sp. CC007]